MEFKDLKIGDKVDVIARKGNTYKGFRGERIQTEIIEVKGVRVKQVRTKYRKEWYRKENFGSTINITGGKLKWLDYLNQKR